MRKSFGVVLFGVVFAFSIKCWGQSSDTRFTTLLIDSVWVANKVSFDLHTIGNKQFVAYYDKNRMMTVASRELGSEKWEKKELPNKLHWDSHNYVVLGFDETGKIHVSGNMHADPLVYFRSEKPCDVHSLVKVDQMTGINEARVTYPKFFNDPDGKLLYLYRIGGSGSGNSHVNQFDAGKETWNQFLPNGLFQGIIGDSSRSAYNKFTKGPDGNFHYIWMWRWTPDVETCHQLCYATSSDFLNWTNIRGEPVSLPFTPDDTKVIVDDVPSKGGLHNSKYDITFLKDGTPIIAYLKYDDEGLTQLFLSKFKNGKWFNKKISDWNFRWKFIGGGDKMTKGASFDFLKSTKAGNIVVNWSTQNGESGSYVVDSDTFEPSSEKLALKPRYPPKAIQRITENPALSLNIQNGKTRGDKSAQSYFLKWESREKSHAKHAPKVIPKGPLSPLYVVAVQNESAALGTSEKSKSRDALTNLDFDKLERVRRSIRKGDASFLPAYQNLIQSAEKAMNEGPFSAVNKTQTPISGDKHDYLSLGPYWWPDPNKSDGLPWIRKDGEVNPLTRGENVDEPRKRKMFSNTYNLGLAFYFSEEKKYADKAIELLRTWFIDPSTKMNPNLNYAQGIPGRNDGRGIGIIEFLGIDKIITTIELLELQNALDAQTSSALRKWLADYLFWLQTSENGLAEKNWKNNHGTWYDVQEVGILYFLGREQEARKVLERVKLTRITKQIEQDGKQPHELARTKSLTYSAMNLKGFTQLAYFGEKLGVDLWNYNPPNAGGIKSAFDFLYPYAKGEKEWKLPQLGKMETSVERLQSLFVLAGSLFGIGEYCEIQSLMADSESLQSLLQPCLN